jgi:isoleucyl-tRNA synthetase
MQYLLVKQDNEYFILAERRIGEFIARADQKKEMKTILSFMGDTLEGISIEKPFKLPGEISLIPDLQLKSTFGTGLHSITPAHDINALRFSYAHNLSREGIICPLKGNLTQPISL